MTIATLDVVLDRPMPQTADAERAVLGSILINNDAYHRVIGILQPADFFKDGNRTIFATMRLLAEQQRAIDILTVKEELAKHGSLDKAGGYAYVTSLVDVVPDIANVERYAELVARASKLRRLITAGNELMRNALIGETEPEVIASEAVAALTLNAAARDTQARSISEFYAEVYADAERRKHGETIDAFQTGFHKLDEYRVIGPTLIVCGAPSKHGKSSWLLNLADGLARHGRKVLHFTLESTPKEITWRHISAMTGIPHHRVKDWWTFSAGEVARIQDAQGIAKRLPILMTRAQRTIDAIAAEIRRVKTLHGLDAVTLDYIQLVTYPGGPRDREERMAVIAQRLLEMALDMGIAVVAASQLNKDRLTRDSGRVHASDLKYAAAIGESARAVLLFQRPRLDNKADEEIPWCKVNFQIEAQNEGRTGDYEAHFSEQTQRFGDGGCAENNCHRAQKSEDKTLW